MNVRLPLRGRLRSSWVLACLTGPLVANARAEPSATASSSVAEAEFVAGNRARTTDPVRACTHYRKSMELEANATVLVRIGECFELEDRPRNAFSAYRLAAKLNRERNAARPKHQALLQQKIDEYVARLDARVRKITVTVTPLPSGAELFLDGEPLSPEELQAPIPVSSLAVHELLVRAPGYQEAVTKGSADLTLTLDAVEPSQISKTPTVEHRAVAAPPTRERAPAPRSVLPRSVEHRSESRSATRVAGFIAGGAGLATLGFAAYFGVRTLALVDEAAPYCYSDGCDEPGYRSLQRATRAQTAGVVLAAAGTVGVGLGTVLILSTSRASSVSGSGDRSVLLLRLGPSGASVRATW